MTQIEDIDPGDSEPVTDERSFLEAAEDSGAVGVLGEAVTRLIDLVGFDRAAEELEPHTVDGLMSLGVLSGVSSGAGVAASGGVTATRVARGPGVSLSRAASTARTPAQTGRAVAKARRSLRRVNPKRPGAHRQAASPPPLKPIDTRLGTGGPLQRFSERTALQAQQGARALSAPGRRRRVITGPRGVMSRLGVSPETRGVVRAGTRTLPIAGTLGFAVSEGLASLTGENLKGLITGGPGSNPAADQARARAVDDAMTEAMRGNVQEAEDILVDAGATQQQASQAVADAQQTRQQQNPSPVTEPEQPPGRTLEQQQDSLADKANQPGLPPTAQQAMQGQQDASQALSLAEEQAKLANEGRLPPVYVSEGPTATGPPGTERSNLRRVNQVLGDVFDMDRPELTDLQHKLFAAGFYGARNYDSIRFGAKDPATMTAFQGFLEQAAQKTNRAIAQVGEGFGPTQGGRIEAPTGISSWRTTLERWAMDAGGVEGAKDSDPDPTFVVSLTDPESIKSQLNQLSQSVIGRGISPRAEQRFVSMFHSRQREAQLAAQRAQQQSREAELQGQRNRAMALREMQRETGAQAQQPQSQPSPGEQVVEVSQPSVAGQAQSFLESEFPTEKGSFDTVQAYDNFLDIIAG